MWNERTLRIPWIRRVVRSVGLNGFVFLWLVRFQVVAHLPISTIHWIIFINKERFEQKDAVCVHVHSQFKHTHILLNTLHFLIAVFLFAQCSPTHWIKVNRLTCVCARDLLCMSNIYIYLSVFSFNMTMQMMHSHTYVLSHARTQPINTLWLLIVCCLLSLLHYSFSRTFAQIYARYSVLGSRSLLPLLLLSLRHGDLLHLLFFYL